ncbi:helix-turn-helix transcriptional regulator [Membranihabitans maritimus]|uniref:helix-turn-helix transcriptional regulator n=1 Tax=Membranihabitans maritimus TaxID=2904244 RepID=UPI001F182003|nr:metalloregulator ArsR/SmtB family transcription factor [Membranihabitans maritimus]
MNNDFAENERSISILKEKGALPLSSIAKEMGVTSEGARFHLLKLEKEGLVRSRSEAKGRGRPKQIWSLTEKGHSRFPDRHAEMTAHLISTIRQTLGEEALEKILDSHEKGILERYRETLRKEGSLESKIKKLVKIRSEEGYMAHYIKEKTNFLFVEDHCPICAAAESCQNFCRAELNIFNEVLGNNVRVQREEHLISGDRRCTYKIWEE